MSKIINRVLEYSFYLLFLLIPLVMFPLNFELFEFNKMMAVYALTIVIAGSWIIKMIIVKKFLFRRSFWDIPLTIFFLSQLLSFIFSIDRHTSFWGYYSRSHGGLASTISYLILYWAFVSNFDGEKVFKVIKILLTSAFLVSIYGILEHFGIDQKFWVQDVKNRVFSTLGQPNWLAAWLVAIIPLTWSLSSQKKTKKFFKSPLILYSSLFGLFYLCLLYTKSRSGFLGFLVAFLVFWGIRALNEKTKLFRKNLSFRILILITLLLSLLAGTPWTPSVREIGAKILKYKDVGRQEAKTQEQQAPIPSGGTESGEIRKIVWKGAVEIWKHYPILGTGPETFAYSYYWYRPREHNDVSEWDFLYNKAHNEYLNFAANTGTVGLAAYLLLIGWFLLWSIRKIKNQISKIKNKNQSLKSKRSNISDVDLKFKFLHLGLLSSFISILVTNFFGFSVVPVALLFFLFPAILVARNQELVINGQKSPGKYQSIAMGLVGLASLFSLYTLARFWIADINFAKGEKLNAAGKYDVAFNELQKATNLRKSEPIFRNDFSSSAANLAVLASQQEAATLSSQLISTAINQSDIAVKSNPYNLNSWKMRTKVFYALSEIDEKYLQGALDTLLRAIELAPTDAKLHYNLGLLYSKLGQNQTAIRIMQETILLKPNYDSARYALALFYEEIGENNKAIGELKYILEKINPNHNPSIEELKKLQ